MVASIEPVMMMTYVKRYPLLLFFSLAYILPWLVWGTSIAAARGWLTFHIPQPLAFWLGLTVATYLTAALTGGWPAIKELLSRLVRWQVSSGWYLLALTLTGLLSLAAIGLYLALGGQHQMGLLLSLSDIWPALLFQSFFFWLTEETAWRGFALPRLQTRFSAVTASLILGLLWGGWHLPLVFIPGSFQATIPFTGFVLSAMATSVLLTWLFNHSHGSVLITALFHAATDVAIAYTGVMSGDIWLFWLFIASQWLMAGVVIMLEGPAHLVRTGDVNAAQYRALGV
ncbi:MAG: CPBP family intramembrane metalloprotease [Anaerolineae bacterium]|nr:CPBP family intramembrane metalloprotease [Anaerolineae bacterium]